MRKTVCWLFVIFYLALVVPAWSANSIFVPVRAEVKTVEECSFDTKDLDLNLYSMMAFGQRAQVTLTMSCQSNVRPVVFEASIEEGLLGNKINGLKLRNSNDPAGYMPYTMSVAPSTGTITGQGRQPLELVVLLDEARTKDQVFSDNYEDLVTITVLN